MERRRIGLEAYHIRLGIRTISQPWAEVDVVTDLHTRAAGVAGVSWPRSAAPPVALRHRILVGGEHLPQTRALRPRELLTPPGAWNTQILLQGLDGVRLHDRLPLLSDKARIPLLNPSPRDGLVPAGGHFLVFGDSEQDAMLAQEVCCPGMQVDHLDPLDLVATE